MPGHEEIEQQRTLLQTYRATLHHYLTQQAVLGPGFVPPAIAHGIRDAREHIARIKATLRSWGMPVDDLPDDAGTPMRSTPARTTTRRAIAVDLSHQQAKWDRFGAFANAPERQFTIISQTLDEHALADVAVLYVAPPYHALLPPHEIALLEAWVLAGGGLFLMGTYAADSHHMGNPSALAGRFGFRFVNNLVLPPERSSRDDARIHVRGFDPALAVKIRVPGEQQQQHPLLHGINEVAVLSACSVEIAANTEGTAAYVLHTPENSAVMRPIGKQDEDGFMPMIDWWEVEQHASVPVLAACRYGRGRVVTCGAMKLCTLDYNDNARLVTNILNWLSE